MRVPYPIRLYVFINATCAQTIVITQVEAIQVDNFLQIMLKESKFTSVDFLAGNSL